MKQKGIDFNRTIKNIQSLLDQTTRIIDKVNILDYAIDVIGRDLAYSVAAHMLYHEEPLEVNFADFPPIELESTQADDRCLKKANIISTTYSIEKLHKSIPDVYQYDFHQECSNYTATYYPEINLAVVSSGMHHLSSAYVANLGSAEVQVCSLKSAFPYITTDGYSWKENGVDLNFNIDCRIAILYELARMKDALNLPEHLQDLLKNVPLVHKTTNWTRDTPSALIENDVLKLELELKDHWISLLQQKCDCSASPHRLDDLAQDIKRIEDQIAEIKAYLSPQNNP